MLLLPTLSQDDVSRCHRVQRWPPQRRHCDNTACQINSVRTATPEPAPRTVDNSREGVHSNRRAEEHCATQRTTSSHRQLGGGVVDLDNLIDTSEHEVGLPVTNDYDGGLAVELRVLGIKWGASTTTSTTMSMPAQRPVEVRDTLYACAAKYRLTLTYTILVT